MRLSQLKPDRRAQLTIRNQGRVAETASRCFEFKKRSQLFIGGAQCTLSCSLGLVNA